MTLQVDVKEDAFKSPRLKQVLQGWVNGLSYDAIAKQNHIGEETARSYGKVLRETFHAKDKAEVIAKAVARGLISIKEVGKVLSVAMLILANVSDDDYTKTRIVRRNQASIHRVTNVA
jgi:DNA-binding CsgD family transcriptional regulator